MLNLRFLSGVSEYDKVEDKYTWAEKLTPVSYNEYAKCLEEMVKKKYVKPFALNLGEMIPRATGNCKSGGIANLAPDQQHRVTTCHSGGYASGGDCNSGGSPSTTCQGGLGPNLGQSNPTPAP